ncbi:AAA family ATPase [bacterium]|nr:MAG: AAA family ATPase [bacterium]
MRETCWFVGAVWTPGGEQLHRFLQEGIWEHGFAEGKPLVHEMQIGDRIAIKATYVRRRGLPFDNQGKPVSVMAIKAVGRITGNEGDGKRVRVAWESLSAPREWYFYTARPTIWRVEPTKEMRRQLIDFAFEGKDQPIEKFLKDPFWGTRYRTDRFSWIPFYEEFATRLLDYRDRRTELVQHLFRAVEESGSPAVTTDQFSDGSTGPMKDVCPFTLMGMFNRGIKPENRTRLAAALAKRLGVAAAPPTTFEAIPLVNNQGTWFYGYQKGRKADDLDRLWDVFAAALSLDEQTDEATDAFVAAFDRAQAVRGVSSNLTMGLFWCRPLRFCPLDTNTRQFISQQYGLEPRLEGQSYVELMGQLEERFAEPDATIRSFPDLSLAAWTPNPHADETPLTDAPTPNSGVPSYTLDHLRDEGCFVSTERLAGMLELLRAKKNLVLQGPPGTGKTWLGKRLGYVLMGERDPSRILSIQFHPSVTYEDFVRGYRPEPRGLALVDGPLLQHASRAAEDSERPYVLVIEEINRGNPAQIFGEALTLLEGDKRRPEEALRLSHARTAEERVHLPPNLFIIGTMNVADRSLALVDLALRRRFAFVDLEPHVGQEWIDWMRSHHASSEPLLTLVRERLTELNRNIEEAKELGPQFRVGHSYVTPAAGALIGDPVAWYSRVVRHEIAPLLEEYWFDNPARAREETEKLLQGIGT